MPKKGSKRAQAIQAEQKAAANAKREKEALSKSIGLPLNASLLTIEAFEEADCKGSLLASKTGWFRHKGCYTYDGIKVPGSMRITGVKGKFQVYYWVHHTCSSVSKYGDGEQTGLSKVFLQDDIVNSSVASFWIRGPGDHWPDCRAGRNEIKPQYKFSKVSARV